MGAPELSNATLSQMRLSQLRELARLIGVGRYSGMLRDELIAAIQVRASRVAVPEAMATAASPSEPPVQPLAASAAPAVEPAPRQEVIQAPSPPLKAIAIEPTLSTSDVVEPSSSPIQTVGIEPTLSTPEVVELPSPSLSAVAAQPSPATPQVVQPPSPTVEIVGQPSSTWVTLLTHDPQWASVSWGISPSDRERALSAGGEQLALRLTDVTDNPDLNGRPHILQEVIVDIAAQEWHLPVPLGDRDYRVELGYRNATGGWYSLARSSVIRIAAEEDLAFEPFTFFNLAGEETGSPWQAPLPAPGLHERIYQQASAGRVRISQGSEGFHEHNQFSAGAAGGQVSGVGLWASGREASGAGMAARQRSFWLMADAELIVYGATDPAATLKVGDQVTPLAEDGTFRFHTAFPDGEQNYPIRAWAADGEQQRSITIDFSRRTPHANVNAKETAVPEWF